MAEDLRLDTGQAIVVLPSALGGFVAHVAVSIPGVLSLDHWGAGPTEAEAVEMLRRYVRHQREKNDVR